MAEGSILERLESHLQDELKLHRSLLNVAERKRDQIVAGNIPAFSQVLSEEQGLLQRGHDLRRVRDAILQVCAKHFSCPHEQLRLAQVLERAPEPLRSQLAGTRMELRAVLERLREINERNLLLIRQSLSFVQDVLSIIHGSSITALDYDQQGQKQAGAGGGGIISTTC